MCLLHLSPIVCPSQLHHRQTHTLHIHLPPTNTFMDTETPFKLYHHPTYTLPIQFLLTHTVMATVYTPPAPTPYSLSISYFGPYGFQQQFHPEYSKPLSYEQFFSFSLIPISTLCLLSYSISGFEAIA